jgi:succinate dehydrogenase flavin-adding protein (antitoxin of CptAB toxin-antitoxin module)
MDLFTQRKAILYRAMHRGTKEADWLIGGFVRTHLDALEDRQVPLLLALVNLDDEGFFRQVEKPDAPYEEVIGLFRDYKASF